VLKGEVVLRLHGGRSVAIAKMSAALFESRQSLLAVTIEVECEQVHCEQKLKVNLLPCIVFSLHSEVSTILVAGIHCSLSIVLTLTLPNNATLMCCADEQRK
jgi:hypothetical protein